MKDQGWFPLNILSKLPFSHLNNFLSVARRPPAQIYATPSLAISSIRYSLFVGMSKDTSDIFCPVQNFLPSSQVREFFSCLQDRKKVQPAQLCRIFDDDRAGDDFRLGVDTIRAAGEMSPMNTTDNDDSVGNCEVNPDDGTSVVKKIEFDKADGVKDVSEIEKTVFCVD